MAKSNLSWELKNSKLIVEILATKDLLSFDLTEIYPDFATYTLVQKMLIAYGVKQKLADKVAKPKDEKLTALEMKAALLALWEQLVNNIWRVAGVAGIKVADLKAKVAEKEAELDEMGIKLAEANALIEKLTAPKNKK